jgi:hypothetical protein
MLFGRDLFVPKVLMRALTSAATSAEVVYEIDSA